MTTLQQNVNPAEIDKFSAIASKWWDPNSEFKPLHAINPLRVQWIKEVVGSLQGKQVIDIGCGGGILSESLAHEGAQVTGIDLAQKSLTVARLHSLESGLSIDYKNIAAEDMANERPSYYDVVICMEMLEHVPDPASIVKACADLAKPNGWVLFSTLNRNTTSYLQAILAAEYLLGMVPKGTHDHKSFIKPSELNHFAMQAGLSDKAITGFGYNPLTDRYYLRPDATVNYFLACKKEA